MKEILVAEKVMPSFVRQEMKNAALSVLQLEALTFVVATVAEAAVVVAAAAVVVVAAVEVIVVVVAAAELMMRLFENPGDHLLHPHVQVVGLLHCFECF